MKIRLSSLSVFSYGALVAALSTLAGCAYTSDYVPPADGRARAIWRTDKVVASLPPSSPACIDATNSVAHGRPERTYITGGRTVVYGGPSIIVWSPVVHVHSSASPATHVYRTTPAPRTAARPTVHSGAGSSSTSHAGRPTTTASSSSSSSGSHGSGTGGAEAAAGLAVAAAVVAIVAMPAITLGIALSNPGDEQRSATSIDRVNAYNDLARVGDTPCSPNAYEIYEYEVEGAP